MDAEEFLAALAPAVTDADARERFLADPRAVLAAAGLELPEWFAISAREGDTAELTITVPSLLDPDTDLSEENLDMVGGGWRGHCNFPIPLSGMDLCTIPERRPGFCH